MTGRSRYSLLGPIALAIALSVAMALLVHKRSASPPSAKPAPERWSISVNRTIRVEPVPGTASYRVRFLRFPDLSNQSVTLESWSPSPTDSGVDPAGRWVGWTVENPTGPAEYTVRTDLEVAANDLASPGHLVDHFHSQAEFVEPDTFRQTRDPLIRSISDGIREPDSLATLRAIWRHVLARLNYGGFDPFDRSAATAARTGTGDCSEFADLFVALARSQGIPARRMNGWTYSGYPYQRHAWVEAWIPSRGWTAFDPTWGKNGHASFERVPAPRAAIGWTPAGPDMEHQPYESWRWWGTSPLFSHRDTVIANKLAK